METDRSVLFVCALAAAVLLAFSALAAWATPSDEMLLTVSALVGIFLGSMVVVARGFLSNAAAPAEGPPADVPAAIVAQLLAGQTDPASLGGPEEPPAPRFRPTVVAALCLGAVALVVIGVMLAFADTPVELWMAYVSVFGTYVSGTTGVAKDLVEEKPAPSVPGPVVSLLITKLYPDGARAAAPADSPSA